MASYHFAVQIIGRKPRGGGKRELSAVAAAAYRARCQLHDERNDRLENYQRKGGLQHAEIMLPDGAAPWLADRERLWNHVESLERRCDAQLCREINVALPHELNDEQRYELVRGFVAEEFTSRGMVADVAWHRPVPENGDDPRNFHAHIMLTLRKANAKGLHPVKTREWNADSMLQSWRRNWETSHNLALRRAGFDNRVDHRSLKAQQEAALFRSDITAAAELSRLPEIHMGPQSRAAERHARVLKSRLRTTGLRQQPQGNTQEPHRSRINRQVDYPRIDQGTRRQWNASIVVRNADRAYAWAEHRERQAVRLRQAELRALRLAGEAEQRWRAWQPVRAGLWQRDRVDVATLQREQWRREWMQALGRAKRARNLLRDVERALAGLLLLRGYQLQRHRALILLPELILHRSKARGRNRQPPSEWF